MAVHLHSVYEIPDSVLYIAQKELGLCGSRDPCGNFAGEEENSAAEGSECQGRPWL